MNYYRIEASNGTNTRVRILRADSVEDAVQLFTTENPSYTITTAHQAWDF